MTQTKHTITLDEARRLAKAMKVRGHAARASDITVWMVDEIRAAWLWVELHDQIPWVGALRDFPEFIVNRQGLRFCMTCGCTEDNPCLGPYGDDPCHWVGDFLCSACAGPEVPQP